MSAGGADIRTIESMRWNDSIRTPADGGPGPRAAATVTPPPSASTKPADDLFPDIPFCLEEVAKAPPQRSTSKPFPAPPEISSHHRPMPKRLRRAMAGNGGSGEDDVEELTIASSAPVRQTSSLPSGISPPNRVKPTATASFIPIKDGESVKKSSV